MLWRFLVKMHASVFRHHFLDSISQKKCSSDRFFLYSVWFDSFCSFFSGNIQIFAGLWSFLKEQWRMCSIKQLLNIRSLYLFAQESIACELCCITPR